MKYAHKTLRYIPPLALIILIAPGARAAYTGALINTVLPFMSRLSGRAGFAITVPFIAMIIGALISNIKRAPKIAGALACVYMLMWLPLYGVKPYTVPPRADAMTVYALCEKLGAQAQAAYESRGWRADSLNRAREATDALGLSKGAHAPPKFAAYPGIMRAAGLAGVYVPLTGEAIISAREPQALWAFTACHEAAHALGIADEGQANIAAYLACARAGGEFEYSAAITALKYAISELNNLDKALADEIIKALAPGVRADAARAPGKSAFGNLFGDYGALTHYLARHMDEINIAQCASTSNGVSMPKSGSL